MRFYLKYVSTVRHRKFADARSLPEWGMGEGFSFRVKQWSQAFETSLWEESGRSLELQTRKTLAYFRQKVMGYYSGNFGERNVDSEVLRFQRRMRRTGQGQFM